MNPAKLTNRDLALIMETRTELMAGETNQRPSLRGARKIAPRNFWWAVGQVFGLTSAQAREAVRSAERWGMNKRRETTTGDMP